MLAYESGDYEQARKFFLPLAEKGDPDSQFNLAMAYNHGNWMVDQEQAEHWFRLAAEQGERKAMFQLGVLYEESDGREAVQWYTKAAERGHATAMFNLAVLYYNGGRVRRSLDEAKKWAEKAQSFGDKDAAELLKAIYRQCR